jgi:type I restriction enzyme M protein
MKVRAEFLASFEEQLAPIGLLDRHKVAGVVSSWWGEVQFDLKSVMALGFEGTLDGWVATIASAIEEDSARFDPLDHKLVKRLLPEFIDELADAEAAVVDLDARLKATESMDDGDESENEPEEVLSDAEIRALKKGRAEAKKRAKATKIDLASRLERKRSAMTVNEVRQVALAVLNNDLRIELSRSVSTHKQAIVREIEGWWDKYRVTLRELVHGRDVANAQLDRFLAEMGYAH